MWGLTRLVIYFLRALWAWFNAIRSGKWPMAQAVITADPATRYSTLTGFTVEIPYTCRFEGELYTGLHEVPSVGSLGSAFTERFAKDHRFLVRVNPAEPEVSIVRDRDQGYVK